MPETHLSMSEIVSGRIIQGTINVEVVRPDLFAFPYDKLITLLNLIKKLNEKILFKNWECLLLTQLWLLPMPLMDMM